MSETVRKDTRYLFVRQRQPPTVTSEHLLLVTPISEQQALDEGVEGADCSSRNKQDAGGDDQMSGQRSFSLTAWHNLWEPIGMAVDTVKKNVFVSLFSVIMVFMGCSSTPHTAAPGLI